MFLTALLSYNPSTKQSTCLKGTVLWFLVCSRRCIITSTSISGHLHQFPRKCLVPQLSLPIPQAPITEIPAPGNLPSTLCFYPFAGSAEFIPMESDFAWLVTGFWNILRIQLCWSTQLSLFAVIQYPTPFCVSIYQCVQSLSKSPCACRVLGECSFCLHQLDPRT